MIYTVKHISKLIDGNIVQFYYDTEITQLSYDSRKLVSPNSSLFFALKGPRRDGHYFLKEVYDKGVRNFVISERVDFRQFPKSNFIQVNDALDAMQLLAAEHRKQFHSIPVIGITGSNGKTIVKEWLYHLLHQDYNIARSPKSYNSQIGVPLSVWQLNEHNNLAIFEAGISQAGEMERLERIIQPSIGIFINIGEAHSEGFRNITEKADEKMKLFRSSKTIIYSADQELLSHVVQNWKQTNNKDFISWGRSSHANLRITDVNHSSNETIIQATYKDGKYSLIIPFTDEASIQNAMACWCTMLHLGIEHELISERMLKLAPVNMRLELKKGVNNTSIINDSYSADLSSLQIALNFLEQQDPAKEKTVILSDFLQTGLPKQELYHSIAQLLTQHRIPKVIGIGEDISAHLPKSLESSHTRQQFFSTTDSFLQHYRFSQFHDESILVKGARIFEFEKIISLLEQKIHQTVLEINLSSLVHNLKQHQSLLKPSTKVMAMVKAFAYGSGGAEIAGILQYHKTDYLGVAYADEGIELRKAGVAIPIMVMNPEEVTFNSLVDYDLEPEIYSFQLLESFDEFLRKEGITKYPIHIEIETGMNRLGFVTAEIDRLGNYLLQSPSFKVQSVFSHLVASEDPKSDEFTTTQFNIFNKAADHLSDMLEYKFLRHIANSAAISRRPELQLDMVRLGIGLYGIETPGSAPIHLQPAATLKSTVAQVRHVKEGESVSYNRRTIMKRDSIIATVRIGYADGYPRSLGNGTGKMLIRGKLANTAGVVCMDMTMIDVTDIKDVKEGDEVIVFGRELSVQQLAQWAGTIPYEIMTGVSQRVKRIYYQE